MTYSAVFFLKEINITYVQVLPEPELVVLVALVLVLLVPGPVLLVPGPVQPLLSWQAQLVSFLVPTGSQPA